MATPSLQETSKIKKHAFLMTRKFHYPEAATPHDMALWMSWGRIDKCTVAMTDRGSHSCHTRDWK